MRSVIEIANTMLEAAGLPAEINECEAVNAANALFVYYMDGEVMTPLFNGYDFACSEAYVLGFEEEDYIQ